MKERPGDEHGRGVKSVPPRMSCEPGASTTNTKAEVTEFWNLAYSSVPRLFNNDDSNIVQQLGKTIDYCWEHFDYYVPKISGNRAEYESKLPQYIAFVTWLLGQLVRATTVPQLETHHAVFEAWQTKVLDLLAARNQHMFVLIMKEYLDAIKDLVSMRSRFSDEPEGALVLRWFSRNTHHQLESQPPVEDLKIESSSQSATTIIILLRVIRSQSYMLAECAPLAMESYWGFLLSLMEDSHVGVVVAALDSVASNINATGFPQNLVLCRKVCAALRDLFGVVSSHQPSHVNSTKSLLTSFSGFLKAALVCRGPGSDSNDKHLFNTLISLLEFKNPFLYSGNISEDYCKLLVFFLKKYPGAADIRSKVQPLLNHATKFPAILLVVETLIIDDLESSWNKECDQPRCGEVLKVSSLWSSLHGILLQSLDKLHVTQKPVLQQRNDKFVTTVFTMVANISLHFNNKGLCDPPIVFFGDRFYQNYNILIQESEKLSIPCTEMTSTAKYMMSLQEVSRVKTSHINRLVAFLSVPWLTHMGSLELQGVRLAPYMEMENMHDTNMKCDCVEGLMVVGGGASVAPEWRMAVLRVARGQPDTAAPLLQLIPALLANTSPDMQPLVITDLLLPYFTSLDPSLTDRLAWVVPDVVCALARDTQLSRVKEGELRVRCKSCLGDSSPTVIDETLEVIAVQLLDEYMKELRLSHSARVRQHVALSLKCWTNHLREETMKKYLVKWLVYIKAEEEPVRSALATVAGHLVSANSEPQFLEFLTEVMMAIAHRSLDKCDKDLQLSVMATVYSIGCRPFDSVLLPTVKTFVFFLAHPSIRNPSIAQIYLTKIAAARNSSVLKIFFRFQDEIFKMISAFLIHNHLLDPMCVKGSLLNLARGLGCQSVQELLDEGAPRHLLKHLLPQVVRNPTGTTILSVVAAAANTELPSLLKNSFQYVYPHLYLFEDKSTIDLVCKLMETHTELTIKMLIGISFKVLTCELLLYFHKEKAKVTEALLELRKYESESVAVLKKQSATTSDSEITEFIQPRFLAMLAYLDSILVSRTGCESNKRHALLTLPDLIKLMGPTHITPVRFKVLATLRSALNLYHSYFPELICFAWRAFVLNVSTLGPLLSTIFVSLLPLLDQFPVEISSVFNILVVDNYSAVAGHLAELYFLPDTPPTHQIYMMVQKELDKLKKQPVKEQLAVTLRLATHENSEVRLRGLHKLRSELSLHRQHLVRLIMAHDNMDPFILKLLEALISGCRDSHEGVRLASSQCLGEIGAIDPGHLPNKIKTEVEEKEMIYVINSDTFMMRALNEFVRAFQAASHTTTMDGFAFGIQELLKIYNVVSSGIWNQLSDSTKEIISPFRESRYKDVVSETDNQSLVPHPIFGTIHSNTFNAWAINWVSRLIPTVTDQFVHRVFSVCQLGLKKDLQALLFFLPYIVLYAILGATKSQSKRIAEEMAAVLFWTDRDDQPSLYADTTPHSILTSSSGQHLPNCSEEAITHTLCAKTVYQLFDFLYQWLRQTKEKMKPNEESTLSSQYHALNDFLKTFSKLEIAEGSYKCKEYTRALLFLEEYITENPDSLQSYLPSLGKIYYQLHDPDSFRGIISIHEAEPTAQEMILYHEVTGKLQDAAACYERLAQESTPSEDFYKAMVQCYLGMDQPSTALQLAQGFLNSASRNQQSLDLLDEQAEAMLSLSMFPQLEQLLTGRGEAGWGASLGRALLHLTKREEPQMVADLDNIRKSLVLSLAGCSLSHSSYRHGYDVIVKLHIISEVEKLGHMVLKMLDCRDLEQMEPVFQGIVREQLDERLKLVQPSCRVLQPVLCVRRVVLSLAQQMFNDRSSDISSLFTTEIGNSWLKSIEIARKSGHYQQAYTNILTVEPYKPKGLFVEKAKLLWAKADPEGALNTLHRGIEHHFPDTCELRSLPTNARVDDRRLCAEAKLLIAIYNDENVNIDMETNLTNYKSAVEVCRNWEKSIVCLAQYKYKYLRTFCDNPESLSKALEYQVYMINYFGKSLQYGCEYIYQSMPRMLSVWLDFGTQLAQDIISNRNKEGLAERRAAMDKMTTLIGTYIERLPTYMFMTAFSQLISRICHPQKDCYRILKAIIIKIIIAYPQQALWMFLSVYKSPYTVRVKRCEEVLRSSEIQKEAELCRTINDFRQLVERLIELGNKPVPSTRGTVTVSIKSFLGSLYRLVSSPTFSPVVIPLQKFRTISLPRSTAKFHNPFPEDMVYISGMKDDVAILSSLQKPKRVTFIGTDGKQYPMMCKPNDDLRLDSRMMEFNSIVNMYLQRDPDARDRGLYIRTYSAVPLSDTSGLIEWLPDLIGLRPVIHAAYKQMGIMMSSKEYKEIICARSDPLAKKRQVYLEKLLPRHPAVLREWYLRQFSHPTTWYLARSSFVRTLAVMSIVGFMLGLGDRHGENILLDATCGDIVHVDFNCLFNKGERFDWPERVPFRLTHNLVNAMGPTGVEGVFRHSCEITTRVMRQQMDQLMSVVRPFCYDPLVSWNTDKNARDENAEMTNEKALEDIQNIEHRLQGIVRTRNRAHAIPLSVEGQVRTLIAEATSIDNLCQMYIGWGPYL